MILTFTFKDPNAVADELWDQVILSNPEATIRERQELINELEEKILKWFRYSEYVTIEVDTEKDTAVIVKPK